MQISNTAIHEAAHAVAAIRSGLVFDSVTAEPDDELELDGALHWLVDDGLGLEMSPQALAVVTLAGPCAEAKLRRLRPDRVFAGVGAAEDRAAVAALGLTESQFIAASRAALELIEHDWLTIERVARALAEFDSLDFDAVAAIVAAHDAGSAGAG